MRTTPFCHELIVKELMFFIFEKVNPFLFSLIRFLSRGRKSINPLIPIFTNKKLSLEGYCIPQNFTPMRMKSFSAFIHQSFPNLEFINSRFVLVPFTSWEGMFLHVQSMTPKVFQEIPQKIKGSIKFEGTFFPKNYQEVSSFLETIKLILAFLVYQ